jgi:predicted permease
MIFRVRQVLAGFAAIWTVTAAGWLVGRWNLLGPRAERVLARLVFFVLTPALLFTTLSRTDPADLATPALAAFAAGALVTGAAGAALARWRWRWPLGETAVAALCASYVNAGNLGIPIAAYVLGDVAAVAPVLLFQTLLVAPLALAVLDRTGGEAQRRTGPGPARLFLFAGRNPIMLGSAAGIAVAASGWRPPAEALRPIELLGSAAVPVALLALGLALAGARSELASPAAPPTPAQAGGRRPASAGRTVEPAYALVALKALVHPALAYLVARLLGLDGPALLAAAVTAALPTAQNVYVFAARYERAEPLARDVVLLSTLIAAATTGVLAAWLG